MNLIPLAHWLSARLLTLPPPLLSQAVGALAAVCHSARSTESARLLHAHILAAIGQLVQTRDENVSLKKDRERERKDKLSISFFI